MQGFPVGGKDGVRMEQKLKASRLLKKMTQLKFIQCSHLLLDVLQVLKMISLKLQEQDCSPAELMKLLDDGKDQLNKMKTR